MESLGNITHRAAFYCLCYINGRNCTGKVGTLLSTETHYNHFIEKGFVVGEGDFKVVGSLDLLGLAAHIGNSHFCISTHTERELTINVSHCAARCARLDYTCTDYGFAVGIGNNTCNDFSSLCGYLRLRRRINCVSTPIRSAKCQKQSS